MKTSHDSEIPKDGQQVITATAFIHHNFDGVEKVFLPKRAATKKFLPNINELPGGHIDFGEDIVKGLKREILEINLKHNVKELKNIGWFSKKEALSMNIHGDTRAIINKLLK